MENSPLKQEAVSLIEQLELFTNMQPYGKATLVGSVALDLIVKRDIDIHIVSSNPALLAQATAIAQQALKNPLVKQVRLKKYHEIPPSGAQAVLITLEECAGFTGPWSINLWLTTDISATGIEKTKKLQELLTAPQRKIIMHIKTALHQKKLLSQGLSTKIYQAVIGHSVTTPQGFFAYLKQEAQSGKASVNE